MDSLTDYIKKAFEYKNVGDYKKAMDYFYKALAIDNESSEILKELALLYSLLCQYDRAKALYEQICVKSPENYAAKLQYAQLCVKLNEIEKAKEILDELYNATYEIDDTVEVLFNILLKENSFEQVITLYKTSKKEITSSVALYLVGLAYFKMSCFKGAEEFFKKSYSAQDGNIDAGYNLAKLLFDKQMYDECQTLLLDLLKYGDDDRVFALLGEIAYQNKHSEDAIKYYSYAIKLNSREAEYYYKLGVIYSLKGFLNEAEQSYCKAVTIDSENILYNYTLAYLYYTNQKFSLASNLIDYVLSLNANHTDSIALKVLLFVNNNEFALAKKYIEKIEKMNDKDDFTYYSLGYYYSKIN